MKTYSCKEPPMGVFGVPFFDRTGEFIRIPEELRKKLPRLEYFGIRTPGARIRFRTDSGKIVLRAVYDRANMLDIGMSLFAAYSFAVYFGKCGKMRHAGLVWPDVNATGNVMEASFEKGPGMEDVTVLFPRNIHIFDVFVDVDDGAKVEAPAPYKYPVPILYYGSSITEGAHAQSPANVYSTAISFHLDVDFYNFGFSGSARAEPEMADYINTVDMSVFVYDYDHNSPNADDLRKTHEPFFLRIRGKHPDLPVVMMSMPREIYTDENRERRAVIRRTYENAVNNGDKNVYFIDGETFFGESDRMFCSSDVIHPNDLGFLGMTRAVEPVIKKILEK